MGTLRWLILHRNPLLPPEAHATTLPDTLAQRAWPLYIELQRQTKARRKRLNAADGAAVHDPQTLLPRRQVSLGRRTVRHGQVVNENAVVLSVLVLNGVALLESCIEKVIVVMAELTELRCIQKSEAIAIATLFNHGARHAEVQPDT